MDMREQYTVGKYDPGKKRADQQGHRSSDTRYGEQYLDESLIHDLRQLASSLERSLDHRREPLPENVHDLIEDLTQLVERAKKKALTTAFYGQPPRI